VVGERDRYLRRIREAVNVQVVMRGHVLRVDGAKESVQEATRILAEMQSILREKGFLKESDVDALLDMVRAEHEPDSLRVPVFIPGRSVRPQTAGQAHYLRAIQEYDIVFSTGPAGTGKTYLAVAMAVSALKQQRARKIVLTRPAREAGESLGFLPGDLQTKINPYLRPLYDAMEDMMDIKLMQRYMAEDVLEIVPLAYMRGRTLDKAFIILDEAQNCTTAQMKMFLTRLGRQSKTVLTGDLSQVDLPAHMKSGLTEAIDILRGISGIAFIRLNQSDIVRHRLVQEIVDAYDVKTGTGRFSEHGRPRNGLNDADAG
jgi:phosphate starvation-inducible protein PhoH and related proteins